MIHQDAIVYGLYAVAVLFFSRRARTRYVAIPVGAALLATLSVLLVDSVAPRVSKSPQGRPREVNAFAVRPLGQAHSDFEQLV